MKIVLVIFMFLVDGLLRSDAVFNWIHYETSVTFTEGQTATLSWTVGSSYSINGVYIHRGQSNADVIKNTTQGITKQLSGRESDLDLIFNRKSNIVNVTFVLRNLVRNDAMKYRITVYDSEPDLEIRTTFLKVLALPVLQFQPNQLGFCVHSIINITCAATFNNPSPSNFTFFKNGTEVESTQGTLISGNTSQAIWMSKALDQVGAFSYYCQAKNQDEGLSGMSYVTTIQVKDPPHIISCKDRIVEEGNSLSWECTTNGSEPLTTSWHKENNMAVVQSGRSLTIANVSRADGGLYTFKASNGEGCPAATKTVQLDVQSLDLRACRDVSYALVTNSCLVSIPADGFPKPNLTCDVYNATNNNYTICSGKNVDTIGTNCYISNSIRSCNFTIPVFARVPNNIKKKFTMTMANQEFKAEYTKKGSTEFKMLKKSLEDILYKIYKYVKYVIEIDVMEFFPGSVVVNFQLTMIANVSDPLLPLKKELNRTKGALDGQYSIKNHPLTGWYIPPVTTTTEPPLSTGAIVGIAIGCAVFVIIIIVLLVYCCYCKRRKVEGNKDIPLDDANYLPVKGIHNKGLSGLK